MPAVGVAQESTTLLNSSSSVTSQAVASSDMPSSNKASLQSNLSLVSYASDSDDDN